MRKWTKLVKASLLLVLLLIAGALLLQSQLARDQMCELAKRRLPILLEGDVKIGRCEIDLLRRTASLHQLSIFSPGADQPILTADSVQVRVKALRPFWGLTELEFVRIERPQLYLDLGSNAGKASTRSAHSADCSARFLTQIKIDQLELNHGQIQVKWDNHHQAQLDDLGIQWKTEKKIAALRITASGGRGTLGPGRDLSLSALAAEARVDLQRQRIEFQRASLGVNNASAVLWGSVEELCDPKLSIQGQIHFPVGAAKKLFGLQGPLDGDLTADLAMSGRPSDPVASVHLTGHQVQFGQFSPGDFTARLLYSNGDLNIDELLLKFGPGTAKVRGKVHLAKNFPAQVEVTPNGAQFGRILENVGLHGAWVDFFATGHVLLSGHFLPSPSFSGEAEIRGTKFLVASRPYDADPQKGADIFGFDQGRVSLGVRILGDRVEMHHVKGEAGRTHFTGSVTLFYDQMRGIAAEGHADPLELSDFRKIVGLNASGRGVVDAEIAGPYPHIQISAKLNMSAFSFWRLALGNLKAQLDYQSQLLAFSEVAGQKGKTSYLGSGEIDFAQRLRMTWGVRVPKGRTEDLLDAIAGLDPRFKRFGRGLSGEASGSIRIDSPPEELDGAVQIELKGTEYYGRRLGDGRLSLRFVDGQDLVVDEFSLHGPIGKLTGQGSFSFDGPLSLQFRGEGLSIRDLIGVERASRLGANGTLMIVGQIQGDSITPQITAYLTSPSLRFADRELGETHLEARVQGSELQIWGRPFGDARAAAQVSLQEPFPYTASVTLSLPEIRPLLPRGAIAQAVSGSLAGTIKAEGELADLDSSELNANFTKLRLSHGDFTAENAVPIRLSYSNGRLNLGSCALRGPNTELSLTGWIDEAKLDLKISGTMDMRLLESFVPSLERTTGRIELTASATGRTQEPTLLGRAEVRDTGLSLKDRALAVRSLSGRVEFSEARILFQDFHGLLNDGRVSLRGTAQVEKLKLKNLEIAIQVDEVALRLIEDLPLTVAGELSLVGKPGAFVLAGDIDILKMRYERPVTLEKLLPEIQKGRGPASYEAPREWVTFDVGVHAKGDVRVDNNIAHAKLSGDLRLTGTNVNPGLLGAIHSTEGSQAFFRGNQFSIRQGLLEFKERRSIDTLFDVHAETQVRQYLVRLHAFGRTSDPKAVLTSEPPLAEGDILSLLTLGVISTDKSNTAGAGAGLAAEALFNASGLDRQIQRFLPKNPLLRDLSFHIATVYNDVTGLVEPNAQLESKFLTEQLKLRLTQPVSGRGTRAQAEYWFDDRLSAQAQWDNEHSDYSIGNWGLNLKLHWEVD